MPLPTADDLFFARPLPAGNGYTFTLPSLLGDMLFDAEQLFGPRDMSFTILGVEFTDGSAPQPWFPGDRKHVVVQLTKIAKEHPQIACFQLAHETVHLLSPGVYGTSSNLEEGLATAFSIHYLKKFGIDARNWVDHAAYIRPLAASEPLMLQNPCPIKTIRDQRRDRTKDFSMSQITAPMLRAVSKDMPQDIADFLAARFRK